MEGNPLFDVRIGVSTIAWSLVSEKQVRLLLNTELRGVLPGVGLLALSKVSPVCESSVIKAVSFNLGCVGFG